MHGLRRSHGFFNIASVLLLWLVFSPASEAFPTFGGNRAKNQPADDDFHWVATWTSMPQLVEPENLPPAPFVRRSFLVTKGRLTQD